MYNTIVTGVPEFPDGTENCGIDSRRLGNYLRFVNHDDKKSNVEAEHVPHLVYMYVLNIRIVGGSFT
jgi:hypothetical protein